MLVTWMEAGHTDQVTRIRSHGWRLVAYAGRSSCKSHGDHTGSLLPGPHLASLSPLPLSAAPLPPLYISTAELTNHSTRFGAA